jgi:hypothetical protein
MYKHAVTVDTREEALEKALDETRRVCNENSSADIHQMNILYTKEPARYAANSKVFPYAPPRPVPEKGAIVTDGNRVGFSWGTMKHDHLLVSGERDATDVWYGMKNWRVIGQNEERKQVCGMIEDTWCADCEHGPLDYNHDKNCAGCTITRPSNFQEADNG